MDCEAKQGSKCWTNAKGMPTGKEKNGGPEGGGLWTEQSGPTVKSRLRLVSLNPMGRNAEKKKGKVIKKHKTCQLQSQDGGQCRWTVEVGVPRTKGTGKWSRGIDPLATRLERSKTARRFLGRYEQPRR